ncbi:MAG: KR domain-containing protein, partial [bacterium]|nr:KR domain-containing protein [bacterium]
SKISDGQYSLNPGSGDDYRRLFSKLKRTGGFPDRVLHLWSLTGDDCEDTGNKSLKEILNAGFYSLAYLAAAIGQHDFDRSVQISVVTDNLSEVTGEEIISPGKAALMGPAKVIPQEYPFMTCDITDVKVPKPGTKEEEILIDQLLEEFYTKPSNRVIAYRNHYRWIQSFEPLPLEEVAGDMPVLRKNGVYLITGGLGNIGLQLAEYLVESVQAKLVLTGRTQLPAREKWGEWLDAHPQDDRISRKILKIEELEKMGGTILPVSADVSDLQQMETVISRGETRLGKINGVIHAAGDVGDSTVTSIQQVNEPNCRTQFLPKMDGLLVLEKVLKNRHPDFCFLTSSLSSILGGLGFSAYAAANIFMDAFVQKVNRERPVRWVSVNWDGWRFEPGGNRDKTNRTNTPDLAMTPEEGIKTFQRILYYKVNQVVVSSGDLRSRIDGWVKLKSLEKEVGSGEKNSSRLYKRPHLLTPYIAPSSQVEKKLVNIWKRFFGFDRVGVQDDFFELGGDSLKAMTVSSKIHKEFNVKIPLAEFFKNPNIKGISRFIKDAGEEKYVSLEAVEKKEYYPLSSAQKRLYILYRLDISAVSYNMHSVFHLEGELDKERMKNTLIKLIKRHESLRTSFIEVEGEPVQKIADSVEFTIGYSGLGSVPGNPGPGGGSLEEGNKHFADSVAKIINDFIKPFELTRSPLLRVGLVKFREKEHLLMIDMHHIISDGASIGIFLKDFNAVFEGRTLQEMDIQYKDYSRWQAGLRESRQLKAQEKYWLEQFSGNPPLLELPTDYVRPARQSFEGNCLTFEIAEKNTGALKKMALAQGVTPFMVLLAVYNILLAKLSGQEDIVIGAPIAGRGHTDLEHIIGMFVNTLPLRNYPESSKTFLEFLGEVKQCTLNAYENQDWQFEDLVDAVVKIRNFSRNPLFDAMLIFQNINITGIEEVMPGIKPYHHNNKTAKFDLKLEGTESDGKLFFIFEYSTRLFNVECIELFIEYFKNILSDAIKSPGKTLPELDTVSEEKKAAIISQLNRELETEVSEMMGDSLFQTRLNDSLDKFNHRIAIQYDDLSISYAQLDQRSDIIGNWLVGSGIKTNTFIGIFSNNLADVIYTVIGIIKAGCVITPLYRGYPDQRIKSMIDATQLQYIFVDKTNALRFEDNVLDKEDKVLIFPEELCSNPQHIKSKTVPQIQYNVEDLLYIHFTSGSTGQPKAILGKNKSLLHFISWEIVTFNLDSRIRVAQFTIPGFDPFLRD